MYSIAYRSAYRGGWKMKPRLYRTREVAQEDADRFNAKGGEHHVVYFDPPWHA